MPLINGFDVSEDHAVTAVSQTVGERRLSIGILRQEDNDIDVSAKPLRPAAVDRTLKRGHRTPGNDKFDTVRRMRVIVVSTHLHVSHVSLADEAQVGDVDLLGVDEFAEHVLALLDDRLDALGARRVRLLLLVGVARAARPAVLLLSRAQNLTTSASQHFHNNGFQQLARRR